MIAFIGLGNIGSSYANTKHNAGFWAIDHYSYRNRMAFQPGDGEYVFSKNKRDKVLLVKPTTMMNKSGSAVKDVMFRWGLLPSQIVVVLDDVDLPLGTIRIRPKGGDGCHGGVDGVVRCGDGGVLICFLSDLAGLDVDVNVKLLQVVAHTLVARSATKLNFVPAECVVSVLRVLCG